MAEQIESLVNDISEKIDILHRYFQRPEDIKVLEKLTLELSKTMKSYFIRKDNLTIAEQRHANSKDDIEASPEIIRSMRQDLESTLGILKAKKLELKKHLKTKLSYQEGLKAEKSFREGKEFMRRGNETISKWVETGDKAVRKALKDLEQHPGLAPNGNPPVADRELRNILNHKVGTDEEVKQKRDRFVEYKKNVWVEQYLNQIIMELKNEHKWVSDSWWDLLVHHLSW